MFTCLGFCGSALHACFLRNLFLRSVCKQTDPVKPHHVTWLKCLPYVALSTWYHDFKSLMKRELVALMTGILGRKFPGTVLASHELKILHRPVGDSM